MVGMPILRDVKLPYVNGYSVYGVYVPGFLERLPLFCAGNLTLVIGCSLRGPQLR